MTRKRKSGQGFGNNYSRKLSELVIHRVFDPGDLNERDKSHAAVFAIWTDNSGLPIGEVPAAKDQEESDEARRSDHQGIDSEAA